MIYTTTASVVTYILFHSHMITANVFECIDIFEKANNETILINVKNSTIGINIPVAYDVEFINKWSRSNHPPHYPTQAHWSQPIIGSHNTNYQMWSKGQEASEAVEGVAEEGNSKNLRSELKDGEKNGSVRDFEIGKDQFNVRQQSQTIKDVDVDEERPYLSAITMIAPSPDWFAGFSNVLPVTCDGFWLEEFTVVSPPYDAGTEDGERYRLNNQETVPRGEVKEIVPGTFTTRVFEKNVNGIVEVRPVAEFKFTLVNGNRRRQRKLRGQKMANEQK